MRSHESREDYLETILILEKKQQFVRSVDVATQLGFSRPSVSVAVANLKAALLLEVDADGGLLLTEAGRALAEQVLNRHTLLTRFLMGLGVEEDIAAEDACRMEHVISQITFEKIREQVEGRHAQ